MSQIGTTQNGGKGDLTPFIFIPYASNDDGTRPLPPSIQVPDWLCPSIHVNGVSYTGNPLQVGVEVQLSVVVENSGSVDSLVVVYLYWIDPTTSFTVQGLHPIGTPQIYAVASLASVESPMISWTPAPPIPGHICFLAQVWCPAEYPQQVGPPQTFDVAHDRHYAQQNVNILQAQAGQSLSFEFFAGNPGTKASTFVLQARPVHAQMLNALEQLYRAEAVPISQKELMLHVVEPGIREHTSHELSLHTQAQERQLCQVIMNIPDNLGTNQFVAIEIDQVAREDDEDDEEKRSRSRRKLGSIGLIVFGL